MTWFGVANSGEILHSTNDDGFFNFAELLGDVSGLIGSTEVKGIIGIPIATGAPEVGQVLKYDGTEWAFLPDATGDAAAPHGLLSPTHLDTEPSSPTRGALVFGSGASPEWARLPLGPAEFVLYSDGTDVLYTRLGPPTPFSLGTSSAPAMTFTGDLDTGLSAESGNVMIASAGGISLLTMDGVNQELTLNGGQVISTTTGGTTSLTQSEYVYLVNTAPATVTLPSNPDVGKTYIIKDAGGNATQLNQIGIAGNGNNIDDNGQIVIRRAFGSFTLVYNGTQWNVL